MGLLPAMDLCIFMENATCTTMDFCSATFYIFILQQTDSKYHDARMDVITTYLCFVKGLKEGLIDLEKISH